MTTRVHYAAPYASQSAASLSSLAIGIAAAHVLTEGSYLHFGWALTLYVGIAGISRAAFLEPVLMICRTRNLQPGILILIGPAGAAAILLGALTAVGYSVASSSSGVGLIMGVTLLSILDLLRLASLFRDESVRALVADAAMLAGVSVVLVASWQGAISETNFVLLWIGSIGVGVCLHIGRKTGTEESAASSLALQAGVRIRIRYLNDFLLSLAPSYAQYFALAALGPSAFVGFRAALTLYSPLNVLIVAVTNLQFRRRTRNSPVKAAALLACFPIFLTAILHALPELGRFVLADFYDLASSFFLPLAVAYLGTTLMQVLSAAMRAEGAIGRSSKMRGAIAVLAITGIGIVLVMGGGAEAVVYVTALSNVAVLAAVWLWAHRPSPRSL